MTRLRATPHPGPLCRERFLRNISRVETLHRSRRRDAQSEIRNPKSEIRNRESLLTSAATSFMGSLLLVAAYQTVAGTPTEGIEFFERKIRPVLVERCFKCHSAQSEKVKGD